MPPSQSSCANSCSRVLAYRSRNQAWSSSPSQRNETPRAARAGDACRWTARTCGNPGLGSPQTASVECGENTVQRDGEVEAQVRLPVLVRLSPALERKHVRGHQRVKRRGAIGSGGGTSREEGQA